MIQRLVKIAFYLKLAIHIGLPQRQRRTRHQSGNRDGIPENNGEGRLSLTNSVFMLLEPHQERVVCKLFQKLYHCFFFHHFKHLPEGELTKRRAYFVCEKSLSEFARTLGIGDYLLFGKGEVLTGGKDRPSILADAFEAVLAAIYLDGGIEPAKKFVFRFIDKADEEKPVVTDYKTTLQEIVQRNPEEAVEYVLVGESGPDHNKTFSVEVHLNSNVIGHGSGRSKKIAEQAAAKEALELMGLKA